MNGIKSQDLVVLLKLASLEEQREKSGSDDRDGDARGEAPYSVRNLEMQLGISKTEVNASIRRSLMTGLASRDRYDRRPKANRRDLLDFIIHGLKYVFLVTPGGMTRSIPTALFAPMLEGLLVSAGQYIYVWPTAEGGLIGQSIKPLFKSVPEAAQRDERLYEYLALADAIRIGAQREVGVASVRLTENLLRR